MLNTNILFFIFMFKLTTDTNHHHHHHHHPITDATTTMSNNKICSQNTQSNPARQGRNRLPNLLLRPPILPCPPLPHLTLHRLSRIHITRGPFLGLHLHSWKFHRSESTHDTTGSGTECIGGRGVLWTFVDWFDSVGSNIGDLLWWYSYGRDTEWYTGL